MPTVQSATPYHQRKRSRRIFAALVCDVTSRVRNESTVLHAIRAAPWRRGAPKAQDRVPRRGTLLRRDQYANCAKRYSVSSSEAKPWALYLTRMRVNVQEEKRKHGITCHTSSPLEKGRAKGAGWMCLEEAHLLRSDQYGDCAKRYSVSSFRAKREIFAIRGLAVNVWKFQTRNLLSTYLRASPHIYCSEAATTTLNPKP